MGATSLEVVAGGAPLGEGAGTASSAVTSSSTRACSRSWTSRLSVRLPLAPVVTMVCAPGLTAIGAPSAATVTGRPSRVTAASAPAGERPIDRDGTRGVTAAASIAACLAASGHDAGSPGLTTKRAASSRRCSASTS